MAAAPRPALHRGLGRGRCQLAGAGASGSWVLARGFSPLASQALLPRVLLEPGSPGRSAGSAGERPRGVPRASHSGLSQGTQRPCGLPVPPGAYRLRASERFFHSAESGSKGTVVCGPRRGVAHLGHVRPSAALPGEGARGAGGAACAHTGASTSTSSYLSWGFKGQSASRESRKTTGLGIL